VVFVEGGSLLGRRYHRYLTVVCYLTVGFALCYSYVEANIANSTLKITQNDVSKTTTTQTFVEYLVLS
jgi:hypothetical protein